MAAISAGSSTVHFVRHAEGVHNVAAHAFPDDSPEADIIYSRPDFQDADLSDLGRQQAEEVVGNLRATSFVPDGSKIVIDLVLTSSLRRALETARALRKIVRKCMWVWSPALRKLMRNFMWKSLEA